MNSSIIWAARVLSNSYLGSVPFRRSKSSNNRGDRKQSRWYSTFQVTRSARHTRGIFLSSRKRSSEFVRSRRRDACHSSALVPTPVVLGKRLTWSMLNLSTAVTVLDFDKLVKTVKEDAHELLHVIVRLIEEANIRISSLRRCCEDKGWQGSVCLNHVAWDPCGNRGLQPNDWNPCHGLNGKTNGRWESNCAGVYGNLRRFRHDCGPGCRKVAVCRTQMTRRNNCPVAYEVVEDEDARTSPSAFTEW